MQMPSVFMGSPKKNNGDVAPIDADDYIFWEELPELPDQTHRMDGGCWGLDELFKLLKSGLFGLFAFPNPIPMLFRP